MRSPLSWCLAVVFCLALLGCPEPIDPEEDGGVGGGSGATGGGGGTAGVFGVEWTWFASPPGTPVSAPLVTHCKTVRNSATVADVSDPQPATPLLGQSVVGAMTVNATSMVGTGSAVATLTVTPSGNSLVVRFQSTTAATSALAGIGTQCDARAGFWVQACPTGGFSGPANFRLRATGTEPFNTTESATAFVVASTPATVSLSTTGPTSKLPFDMTASRDFWTGNCPVFQFTLMNVAHPADDTHSLASDATFTLDLSQ